MWWVRIIVANESGYGRWVPTGQIDFDEAKWYMRNYPDPFGAIWVLEYLQWR